MIHAKKGRVKEMMRGTVKWYNKLKGFGFIETEDGRDIFVHYSGVTEGSETLMEEEREVTFDVQDGPKGPQAVNVTVIY